MSRLLANNTHIYFSDIMENCFIKGKITKCQTYFICKSKWRIFPTWLMCPYSLLTISRSLSMKTSTRDRIGTIAKDIINIV